MSESTPCFILVFAAIVYVAWYIFDSVKPPDDFDRFGW